LLRILSRRKPRRHWEKSHVQGEEPLRAARPTRAAMIAESVPGFRNPGPWHIGLRQRERWRKFQCVVASCNSGIDIVLYP
jgi:hypothetical protein